MVVPTGRPHQWFAPRQVYFAKHAHLAVNDPLNLSCILELLAGLEKVGITGNDVMQVRNLSPKDNQFGLSILGKQSNTVGPIGRRLAGNSISMPAILTNVLQDLALEGIQVFIGELANARGHGARVMI